jgi:hypothetical protein
MTVMYEKSDRGADSGTIQSLPVSVYSRRRSSSSTGVEAVSPEDGMCVVCRDEFSDGDATRVLPCFHGFHVRCIDPWLSLNRRCPVCHTLVDVS